jgi:hypothetical protein
LLAVEEQRRAATTSEERRLEAAPDNESPDPALPAADAFPIYGWLERSNPEPDAESDWPRSLVKTKADGRRGETPQV